MTSGFEPLSFETERLNLSVLTPTQAGLVAAYLLRNRAFHQTWFPERDDDVFTAEHQAKVLRYEYEEFEAGRALPFWLSLKDEPDQIIGRIILSPIIRGAFRSAIISYHLDQAVIGCGLASEAGKALIELAFSTFDLHRIEASILPENEHSIALVTRLGFELEGLSRRYLQIDGQWADHLHFVRLADGPVNIAPDEPQLSNERVLVRPLQWGDSESMIDYQLRNRDHLSAFSPQLCDMTHAAWRRQFCDLMLATQTGHIIEFGVFLPDRPKRLIGLLHVRNLQHLPFSSCELGYSIDEALTGQGLAFEALTLLLDYLFSVLKLHRITARCLESNRRSIRVLEKTGFTDCGREIQAVLVDGQWQDLLCYQLFNDLVELR